MDDCTRIIKHSKASDWEFPFDNKTLYEIELDHHFTLLEKLRIAESFANRQTQGRHLKGIAESKKRLAKLDDEINGTNGCAHRVGSTAYFSFCKKWLKRYGHLSAYRNAWRHFPNL